MAADEAFPWHTTIIPSLSWENSWTARYSCRWSSWPSRPSRPGPSGRAEEPAMPRGRPPRPPGLSLNDRADGFSRRLPLVITWTTRIRTIRPDSGGKSEPRNTPNTRKGIRTVAPHSLVFPCGPFYRGGSRSGCARAGPAWPVRDEPQRHRGTEKMSHDRLERPALIPGHSSRPRWPLLAVFPNSSASLR
jgi:hypothetical protein